MSLIERIRTAHDDGKSFNLLPFEVELVRRLIDWVNEDSSGVLACINHSAGCPLDDPCDSCRGARILEAMSRL